MDNVPFARVEWYGDIPVISGQSCFRSWNIFKSGHALGVNAERERCAGVVRGKIDLHPLGMDYSANRALDSAASAIEKGESVE